MSSDIMEDDGTFWRNNTSDDTIFLGDWDPMIER